MLRVGVQKGHPIRSSSALNVLNLEVEALAFRIMHLFTPVDDTSLVQLPDALWQ